jgi:hypothetical protein
VVDREQSRSGTGFDATSGGRIYNWPPLARGHARLPRNTQV